MDGIKEWAIALCAAATLCAVCEMLTAAGRQGRAFRFVTASVMLCVIASPLAEIYSFRTRAADYISSPCEPDLMLYSTVEKQAESAVSAGVEDIVQRCADSLGIALDKIHVDMDISRDGCISIGQITAVTISADHSAADRLERELQTVYGLDAEVQVPED